MATAMLLLQDDSLSVGEEFAIQRELYRKRKAVVDAAVDRYQERHESAAMCTRCSSPREPGKTLCATHLERGRARANADYDKRRVGRYRCGLCGESGHQRTRCSKLSADK